MRTKPTEVLLIFDLDGTLVDSSGQILAALNETCRELNYSLIPEELFAKKLGLPISLIISHLNLDESKEFNFISIFRTKLQKSIEESNSLYGGVEEFLALSKTLGFNLAIATSKPTYLAKLVVAKSALFNYIDFVQGTDDFPAKPAPDVVLRCLRHFNTGSGIMFGDRVEDMDAASSAGIISIGLAQGHHTVENLVNNGARFAYRNFSELLDNNHRVWKLCNLEKS